MTPKPRASKLRLYITTPEIQASMQATLAAIPGSSTGRQEQRLEAELHKWPLTTFDMSRGIDLYDPRARIKGLRDKGLPIVKTWVHVETCDGEMHRVGLFTLLRGVSALAKEMV